LYGKEKGPTRYLPGEACILRFTQVFS